MVTKANTPIVKLKDFDETINLMIYGPAGCGKSVEAGTAPKALFIGTEEGQISAARRGSEAELWPCKTWGDFELAAKWLKDGGMKHYEWAILDSWTSMQQFAWRHIIDLGGMSRNPQRDLDIPEIQEHFKMQQMMKRTCMEFIGLPINTIHLAQTMQADSDEGEDLVYPQILGKDGAIAQFIMGQMSSVGHMVVEENDAGKKVHRIYWDHDPPHAGRDRYDCLGPYTEELTIPQIVSRIKRSGSKTVRRGGLGAEDGKTRSTRSTTTKRRRRTSTTGKAS